MADTNNHSGAGVSTQQEEQMWCQWLQHNAPVLQLLVSFVGLISLVFIYWQLQETARWNKINTQHNLIKSLPEYALKRELDKFLVDKGLEPLIEIPQDKAKEFFADPLHRNMIAHYLDGWEFFCAAVKFGYLDEKYAYEVAGHATVRKYRTFKNVISIYELEGGPTYTCLKHVATKWKDRVDRDTQASHRSESAKWPPNP